MRILILGAGAWGTALALALADRHAVMLWGRDADAMAAMQIQRENKPYLPGFTFPSSLMVCSDLALAMAHLNAPDVALASSSPMPEGQLATASGLLIVATSMSGLRPLCMQLHTLRESGCRLPNLVSLCKGFEQASSWLPHQVMRAVLGQALPIGVLSGPSFAQEVARGLPCALTIGSTDAALCERVVAAVHSRNLRIYSTDDVVGVEVGGAVKNILAIATGVIDGLGFGANARAALITRGLAEITRLGVVLGGRSETFMGLTGVGDLLLTCTGDLSRNRQVGLALAQGKPLAEIEAELGHVAEGVRCAQVVRSLARAHRIDMPISDAVAGVLFDGDGALEMVTRLLSRDPRTEVA